MSTRLERCLSELRDRGEGAFMPFLVIGDPDLAGSHALTDALVEAGADILEFGFPFSDPPADGPVIQAADQRALAAGTTPEHCLEFLAEVNRRHDKPLALLLYYNLVLKMGVERFYRRAAEAGVDAVLIADLPIEEAEPALAAAEATGIHPVFLISELSSDARIERLVRRASGYLYLLARVGITGAKAETAVGLEETVARVRRYSDLPLLAGFGISGPEQVRAVLDQGADGAICGSALIRRLEQNLEGGVEAAARELGTLAGALKEATRRARPASGVASAG